MIYLTSIVFGVLCISVLSGMFAHWLGADHRWTTDQQLLDLGRQLRDVRGDLRRVLAIAQGGGGIDETLAAPDPFDDEPMASMDRLSHIVACYARDGLDPDEIGAALNMPAGLVRELLAPDCDCATARTPCEHGMIDPLTDWEEPLIAPATDSLPILSALTETIPVPAGIGQHQAGVTVEAGDVDCPVCEVPAGRPCVYVISGQVIGMAHWARWHALGKPCPSGCPDCPTIYGRGATPGEVTFGAGPRPDAEDQHVCTDDCDPWCEQAALGEDQDDQGADSGAGAAAGEGSAPAPAAPCWCGGDCPNGDGGHACDKAADIAELQELLQPVGGTITDDGWVLDADGNGIAYVPGAQEVTASAPTD